MLTQLESKLRGGPENDHPTGDFIWPCMHCDAEFHGDQYDYICYKCAKEEDQKNDPKKSYGLVIVSLLAVVVFVLILL